MSGIGEIIGYAKGEQVKLDRPDGVSFRIGDGEDETVTVSIQHGELRLHSNSWAKNLAVIGESGNVLRAVVIQR